jgi:hypothetical protein
LQNSLLKQSWHIAHWLFGLITQRDLETTTMWQSRKPARSYSSKSLYFEILEDRQMLSTMGSLLAPSLPLAAPAISAVVQTSPAFGEAMVATQTMVTTFFSSNSSLELVGYKNAPSVFAPAGRLEIVTESVSFGVKISFGITQIQFQLGQGVQKSTNGIDTGLRVNTKEALALEPDDGLEISAITVAAAAGRTNETARIFSVQGAETISASGPAIGVGVNGQTAVVGATVPGVIVAARANAVPGASNNPYAPLFNPSLPNLSRREGAPSVPLGPIAETPARPAPILASPLNAPSLEVDSVIDQGRYSPQTSGLLTDGLPVDLAAMDSALQEFLEELNDLQLNVTGWLSTVGPLPWLFVSLAVAATTFELFRHQAQNDQGKTFGRNDAIGLR